MPSTRSLFFLVLLSLGFSNQLLAFEEHQDKFNAFISEQFKKSVKKISVDGKFTTVYFDSDENGQVDIISKFEGEALVQQKIDFNGDGKFDRVTDYNSERKNFKIQKMDSDFDGKVDQMSFSSVDPGNGELASVRRLMDSNADGIFEYSSGHKVARIQNGNQSQAPRQSYKNDMQETVRPCGEIKLDRRRPFTVGLKQFTNDLRDILVNVGAGKKGVKKFFSSSDNSLKYQVYIDKKCGQHEKLKKFLNPTVFSKGLMRGLRCMNKLDKISKGFVFNPRTRSFEKGKGCLNPSFGLEPASSKNGQILPQLKCDSKVLDGKTVPRKITMARVNFVNLVSKLAVDRKFYGQATSTIVSDGEDHGEQNLKERGLLARPEANMTKREPTSEELRNARLKIVCSEAEKSFNKSGEEATILARTSTDDKKTITCSEGHVKVKAPFISFDPNAIADNLEGKSDEEKEIEIQKLFFHESMHLLGYQHGQDVEYPESCARCEFNHDCDVNNVHCKICTGDFPNSRSGVEDYRALAENDLGYGGPNDPNRGILIKSRDKGGIFNHWSENKQK